jgi:hypothetical protein
MDLPLYIYFLIPCFLLGITVYFQHTAPLYLKLFPILLAINLTVEIGGQWVAFRFGSNVTLFNFYTAFELSFFLFMLREMIVNPRLKRVILILIWGYPLFCIINILFIQKPGNWHSISYGIGNILVVGFAIYYFFELFKRPKAINLLREPAFWICCGLLFFYSCSFPFLGLVNFMGNAPGVIIRNFSSIITLLNILLYVLFTIAFLCRLQFRRPVL